MSHNSLGTSYCRIPAKRTGISRKTSAFIAGRNGADREVPACFARGGTGRYGTLKVNKHCAVQFTMLSSLEYYGIMCSERVSLNNFKINVLSEFQASDANQNPFQTLVLEPINVQYFV